MEIFHKRALSPKTLLRVLTNMALPEKEKQPIAVTFYLTFKCNAKCEFCSQGEYIFGERKGQYRGETNLEKQLEVLRVVRRDVPNIYFSGGEPTVYPGFERMLEESVNLGFQSIGVNTNGFLFEPKFLEKANMLVVSLYSMDPEKISSVYGVAPKMGEKVLNNIRQYAKERDPGMSVSINSVVTSNNIDDVYEIAKFCNELGIQLNVAPAILENGRPDPGLVGNPKYQTLIDWLIGQNGMVISSHAYLETIRDFEPFTCVPNSLPGIHPNGDIIVPCHNLPEEPEMVNVLEAGGVRKALEIGRAEFEKKHGILDTQRRCAEMCHKACYIEGTGLSTVSGVTRMVRGGIKYLFNTNDKFS